jgi:hypothetical protein
VFHVSPFCSVAGLYRFRFMHGRAPMADPAGNMQLTRTVARIDHDDAEGALIQTSVSGDLLPLTSRSLRRAFFGMPLMTLGVIGRIHLQAARLWLKRVPFFRKPEPPIGFVTR